LLSVAEIDFANLLIVVAAAFAAPLVLGLAPALRLPSVVLELVAGIVIGPAGFGWVEVDEPIRVLSLIGLAFLLFLGDSRSSSRGFAAGGLASSAGASRSGSASPW
jgi:Kef-type K+ transport system membrane component KefB